MIPHVTTERRKSSRDAAQPWLPFDVERQDAGLDDLLFALPTISEAERNRPRPSSAWAMPRENGHDGQWKGKA